MMASEENKAEKYIDDYIWEIHEQPGNRHPLGKLGHFIGVILLLMFIPVLIPMFIFTWIASPIYFWFYRKKPISPKPYFNFDRHKVKGLSFWDKFGCEYCELTNGTLQWMLAITNEIEKKWCPIQNKCHPHCNKAKAWRDDFLPFEHSPEQRENYYQENFSKETQ